MHRKSMPSKGINLAAMADWSNSELDSSDNVAEKLEQARQKINRNELMQSESTFGTPIPIKQRYFNNDQ